MLYYDLRRRISYWFLSFIVVALLLRKIKSFVNVLIVQKYFAEFMNHKKTQTIAPNLNDLDSPLINVFSFTFVNFFIFTCTSIFKKFLQVLNDPSNV